MSLCESGDQCRGSVKSLSRFSLKILQIFVKLEYDMKIGKTAHVLMLKEMVIHHGNDNALFTTRLPSFLAHFLCCVCFVLHRVDGHIVANSPQQHTLYSYFPIVKYSPQNTLVLGTVFENHKAELHVQHRSHLLNNAWLTCFGYFLKHRLAPSGSAIVS